MYTAHTVLTYICMKNLMCIKHMWALHTCIVQMSAKADHNSEAVFVNLLRIPGIDSQADRYDNPIWPTDPSGYIGWNRFLSFLNVYKFGVRVLINMTINNSAIVEGLKPPKSASSQRRKSAECFRYSRKSNAQIFSTTCSAGILEQSMGAIGLVGT